MWKLLTFDDPLSNYAGTITSIKMVMVFLKIVLKKQFFRVDPQIWDTFHPKIV